LASCCAGILPSLSNRAPAHSRCSRRIGREPAETRQFQISSSQVVGSSMSTTDIPPLQASGAALTEHAFNSALDVLDPNHRGACCCVSRAFRAACDHVNSHAGVLRVWSEVPDTFFTRFPNLCTLDLTGVADDRSLARLRGLLPRLSTLVCVECPLLTDDGLGSLASDPIRCTLRSIDLTFSEGTSYGATIVLRRALPGLELIRRQPASFDGCFLTPFGEGRVEIHTYYADGSFKFSRTQQSKGYVRFLKKKPNEDFFYDSLQYSDFRGVMGWPPWAQFFYRPGVALKFATSMDGSSARNVLVAQLLSGIRAPEAWPPVADDKVPLGQSVYIREDGEVLLSQAPGEAAEHGAAAMVSRMEVQQLESLMPPASLVDEIEAFELERKRFEDVQRVEVLVAMEEHLHRFLQ